MEQVRVVKIGEMTIEFRGDEALTAGALRAFTGSTPMDAEIDALPLPASPRWLRISLRILRWYRARISPRLGNRCVFEPSCSRYAELALQRHGFFRGSLLTSKRLHRCRPGAGGIDLP